MADSKITALTAISTVDPTADPLVIVDVSDTSMAASGTTKKSTINQLLGAGGTATLASATITGAATVGTTLGVTGVSTFAAGTALLPALTTTGDTNTGIYYPAADTFAVTTGGTERYRVDSSGNVGIGVTPSAWGTYKGLQVGYASLAGYAGSDTFLGSNVYFDGGSFRYISTATASNYRQLGGVHQWSIAPSGTAGNAITFTQAMTLTDAGDLLIGTTTMPSGVTFARLVAKSTSGDWSGVIWNSNATPYGFRIQHDTDSNGTGNEFLYCLGGANLRASIRSNGGIANYQANDVSLSDSRLKTDIKPLASYWNKIKSLELVTFKYKDQTHSDDNIGLIAQQVESVAPELVDVDGFGETPDDGVPLKTIYTTDLYHAAIKALQEAMTRIEALESKLA